METARKFIEYVGSAEAVLEKAKRDFEAGNYQWAATAANYVVYAEPENKEARYLCADALEQLGYQAESSIWRNAYLVGAEELRQGVPETAKKKPGASDENLQNNILNQASTRLVLGYLGIAIGGEKAADEDFRFRLQITEDDEITESFILHLYAGTLLIYDERKEANGEKINVNKVKGNDTNEEEYYVKGPSEFVVALVQKRLDIVKELIETNCYDQLARIESYVVEMSQYAQFHLVDR
ncbi:MAG: hypothetical protein LUF92_15005 [Clostridiales bacterium]|nr:hypothetical protein [Clostridiales bacterium]